jgi:ATP-binding cassette subfamily F protein 3
LHIEQEVEGSDVAVLDAILATDIEREALKKEAKILQQILEYESTKDSTLDISLIPKSEEEDEFGLLYLDFSEKSQRLSEIYNRWEEIEGDRAVSRASTILAGLGFTPEMQQKPTSAYSGGFRMRIALAQALFIDPDILLLDEPTNHLDLLSVLWLEDYLLSYSKTLIIVSHDRDFLNTVCTDIIHMQNKKLVRYKGNYDTFEKLYYENLKVQQRQQENQEKEIKNLEDFITENRASAATAKMAQSRVKR